MQIIDELNKFKESRSNIGLWAPSCIQHGFTGSATFTDPRFQIPSANGSTVSEAIR
jgi:hypothetical protein